MGLLGAGFEVVGMRGEGEGIGANAHDQKPESGLRAWRTCFQSAEPYTLFLIVRYTLQVVQPVRTFGREALFRRGAKT